MSTDDKPDYRTMTDHNGRVTGVMLMNKPPKQEDTDCPVHLVRIESEIYEDIFEEGEGDFTGCGISVNVGQTFPNLQAMTDFLHNGYGLSKDPNDYGPDDDGKNMLFTSTTVADHSQHQNGGWFEATEAEIEKWQKGEIKLYSENYTIHFIYPR